MVSRRSFVQQGVNGAAALAGWGLMRHGAPGGGPPPVAMPAGFPIRRRGTTEVTLRAAASEWNVGSAPVARALTFNGQVPGPTIRVAEGDTVRVTLINDLAEPTTIHWHGMPVPFAMDGVPDLTQPAVPPGERFVYEFVASVSGSYWYHSHYAFQFERGLFGALIVTPRREPLSYDREYTLVLDDWLLNPDHPTPSVSPYNWSVGGIGMGSMEMRMIDQAGIPDTGRVPPPSGTGMMGTGSAGGMDETGDIPVRAMPASHGAPAREPVFDAYTVNGLTGPAGTELVARRGDRVRLRLINASTATVIPFYVAGHRLTITHLDGQPITPAVVDAVPVGMGERVDVLVDANNPGAWRVGSTDPRHRAKGMALVLRYDGIRPDATVEDPPPPRLGPKPYEGLQGETPLLAVPVEHTYTLSLRQNGPIRWLINGKAYPDTAPIAVRNGERVRLRIVNNTLFAHPIHLHGHFFDVVRPYGALDNVERPIRKDTLTLYHIDDHIVEFTAGNPGSGWLLHCHNQYHHVGGMGLEVQYR